MSSASPTPQAISRRAAYLLLAANISVGSLAFTMVTIVLDDLSPMTLAAARVAVSALTFTAIVLAMPHVRRPVARGDRLRFFLCGFIGSVGFHVLYQYGQHRSSVAIASVVMATYPVLTSLGEVVFLRHRLHAMQVLGVLATVVGCAQIGLLGGNGATGASMIGVIALLGAAVAWAGVTVMTRSLGGRYDSWWLNTPGTIVGALVMLLIDAPHLGELGSLSWKGWLAVVWLGSASSAFIYYSTAKVLAVMSATTTTSIIMIVTPASILVGWVVLGERPGLVELVGAALVIAGVLTVTRWANEADISATQRSIEPALDTG